MAGKQLNIRINADDEKLLAALSKRLGLDRTNVIRLALRRLLQQEENRKK